MHEFGVRLDHVVKKDEQPECSIQRYSTLLQWHRSMLSSICL